jgi:hypothetical protein
MLSDEVFAVHIKLWLLTASSFLLVSLFMSISFQVRDQDIIYVLAGISTEGREVAWTWLKVCSSWLTSSL